MSGPELITLGCRLNIAESEAMRALAAGQDDLVIVNSCAVTQEAVRQTRKAIRKAHRDRPDARIVVTGCAAQIEPGTFAAMPEVSRVLGNGEKFDSLFLLPQPSIPSYPKPSIPSEVEGRAPDTVGPSTSLGMDGWGGGAKVQVSDIFAPRPYIPTIARSPTHARAFVEVQTGCDHRCTFCVIPFGRGNSRSADADHIVTQVRALVAAGYREVILTGVDLTSYRAGLGALVEAILGGVPALPRLRLSSLDPVEIDDHLFALITGERRVMPHLHLSLQAGSDMILKRMKRRHGRAQAIDLVARIKAARPEVAIGADLIAGFPTETEAMFEQSVRLVGECDIVFGHIFPYSPRAGTPAARMPQLEREVVRARATRLRTACEARQAAWLQSLVGTTQRVLLELDGTTGHAENFAKVTTSRASPGVADLTITGVRGSVLTGTPG